MKNIFLKPTDKETNLVRVWNDVEKTKFTLKVGGEVNDTFKEYVNIYITNDEKIEDGDWGLSKINGVVKYRNGYGYKHYEKIVLTNDTSLIEDGVQEVNSSFLSFYAENRPDYVRVEKWLDDDAKKLYTINFPQKEEYSNIQKKSLENNREFVNNTSTKKLESLMKKFDNHEIESKEELDQIIAKEMYKQSNLQIVINKPTEKELIKEAKKVWEELHPNPIEMALFGAKWQAEQDKNKYSEEDVKEAFSDGWALRDGVLPFPKAKKGWFEQFEKK